MALDDRPADREANPHAVRLGGVEGLEQPLGGARIETRSGVSHVQPDAATGVESRFDDDGSGPIRHFVHRLGRVQQQVEDHLLQLNAVDADSRQVFSELRLQERSAPAQFGGREGEHLACHVVEIGRLQGGRRR